MRYLDFSLYEKLCCTHPEKDDEDKWNRAYKKYSEHFHSISNRFPKSFLKEFQKYQFHDNIIDSITIAKKPLKTKCQYDICIRLIDYHKKEVIHQLRFTNVRNMKTNMLFEGCAGSFDWLYSEFLEVNENRLSFEVILFEDSSLYLEFAQLYYKKIISKL